MQRLLIILVFTVPLSICFAQEDNSKRKSSIVFGGDFLWNSKHRIQEVRGNKKNELTLGGKLGYFFSDNDLLLIRPRIDVEFTTNTSGVKGNEINICGELVYRRFFGNSFFAGVFAGGGWERAFATNYSYGEPSFDKEIYAGFELGYVLFLSPQVGIESTLHYSIRKIEFIRDEGDISGYPYSRAGISIGFIYLFKQ